ncbi:MAG: hypothetical protein WA215_00500 [Candidatus Cybelea sp.]
MELTPFREERPHALGPTVEHSVPSVGAYRHPAGGKRLQNVGTPK